jgi:hypothetical protein
MKVLGLKTGGISFQHFEADQEIKPTGVNRWVPDQRTGSGRELLAQLCGRLTPNHFDHKIPSRLDVPIYLTGALAPIIGHDLPQQNEQLRGFARKAADGEISHKRENTLIRPLRKICAQSFQPESISAPFRLWFLKGWQRQAEPDLQWLIPAYHSVPDCLPHESHSPIPTRKTQMRG